MVDTVNILGLPVALSLDGSEYTPVVQGGTTKRAAASLFDISGASAGSVQDANTVYAGPTSGSAAGPSFRALVAADLGSVVLLPANGGTGLSSYAIGDLIYADGATSLAKLAGVATGNALISGGVTTAPSWGKIGLTTHVDGTLPVANGGTGIASYAVGDLIYASGATTLAKLADVAVGRVLMSGGVGVAPAWGVVNFGDQTTANYATRTAAAAATIPAGITTIVTMGYAAAGDLGGAVYKSVGGSTTGGFQSADGGWWQIEVPVLNPIMFGADATGVADSTTAFQTACDIGGAIEMTPGSYKIGTTTPVTITKKCHLYGSGADFTNTATAAVNILPGSTAQNLFQINAHGVIFENFNINGTGGRFAVGQGKAIAVGTDGGGTATGAIDIGVNANRLNDASGSFTANDVGKYITVAGAGAAGARLNTTIASYVSATAVNLTAAASTTVTNATYKYGYVYEGCIFRGISISSNSIGIHFINASDWLIEGNCSIQSYYATQIECQVNSDKGDSSILGSKFASDSTAGRNVYWLSSGSLRCLDNKFLTSQDDIYVDWSWALSGGGVFVGNSSENSTRSFFRWTGTVVQANTIISGNNLNGQDAQIYFDNSAGTAVATEVNIVANSFNTSASTNIIDFGRAVSGAMVDANMVNGNSYGGSTFLQIRSGAANVKVGDNDVRNVTNIYTNASSSTTYTTATTVNTQTGTTHTVEDTDRGKLITYTSASAKAITLPQAGTSGLFLSSWFAYFDNAGAGTATITPTTSTINGAATLVLQQNQNAIVISDGTNYRAIVGVNVRGPSSSTNNAIALWNGTSGQLLKDSSVTWDGSTLDVAGTAQVNTLRIDQAASSVGTGTKTISNAADSSTNFGKYFSISLNGTTVYVPCSTVAPT